MVIYVIRSIDLMLYRAWNFASQPKRRNQVIKSFRATSQRLVAGRMTRGSGGMAVVRASLLLP